MRDLKKTFELYWQNYGGIKALAGSSYLHFSLIIAFILACFGSDNWNWASDSKTILACTLGFSFAGYSLMIGMADKKFLTLIKGDFSDGKPSTLMVVASAFTHFFLVQCVALLYSLFTTALDIQNVLIFKFLGIFLLFYSIFLLAASAFAALNFVSWYDKTDTSKIE